MNNKDFEIAERWAIIGFVGNLVLSIVKAWAGVVANSNAMIADAVHSASDIFASLFVYISLKIAKRPADENHPYGHGKAEVISTLIVGVMLALAGIQIIRTSMNTITDGNIAVPGNLALYAAILSIVVKELMYRFTYRVGKKINSPSTIANALDHRSDAFSSVATLIGIAGAKLKFPILDPIAGIVVAFFIMKMSYEITREAVKQIMDESPGKEKINEIKDIAMSVDGVLDAHYIRIRRSGSVYFVDMDIVTSQNITIREAHDICEIVREKIFTMLERIEEVRVHIDPSSKKEEGDTVV